MKKGKKTVFLRTGALGLAVLLLAAMAGCGEQTAAEAETEEIPTVSSEGALVSYDGGELVLDADGKTLTFLTDGETFFSLARGFVAGDTFTVSCPESSETALSVSSVENKKLEVYSLRGTVLSVSTEELRLETEDGDKVSFSIAGAELNLWQGLRKGIYVQLDCLGDAVGGSCVWVQRVTDNDGEAFLKPEEAVPSEEMATEETTEETAGETTEASPAWPYEACEDTVWPSVRANLRIGPGMEYPCVGEAECGEELARCGLSGEWSAVRIDGREYYIATELLLTERPGKLSAIAYDANGGMAAPETQHKLGGESLVLSELTPVRAGWHFICWNTNAKGFGMIFHPGEEYELDGDVTLYAQWEEGEPDVPEEPTASEEMSEEGSEETTEETEEEAVPIRDSASAIAGTLVSLDDDQLCLEAVGISYSFDVSMATFTAECGVHPGDRVTVRYAGRLGADRDSTAAPAVRVEITAGEGVVSGKVTAVGKNLVAISLGKTELFAAVETPEAEVGDRVTLSLDAPSGNLYAATVK